MASAKSSQPRRLNHSASGIRRVERLSRLRLKGAAPDAAKSALFTEARAGPTLRLVPLVPSHRVDMEPLIVLFVLPVLIGIAAVALFRDTTKSSCVATFASPLVVFACLRFLDPEGTWNWLATLLVSPLAIAFALGAVMACYGRSQVRKRQPRNGT